MEKPTSEPFSPTPKDEWVKLATKDIRGKDFQDTLTSLNDDGIRIQPFYSQEDEVSGMEGYRSAFHPAPEIPGMSCRVWTNVAAFEVNDLQTTNRSIHEALMNGVDGLLLKVKGLIDWREVLMDVGIPYVKIYLEPEGNAVEAWEGFRAWLESTGVKPEELNGGIVWDGFAQALITPLDPEKILDQNMSLLTSTASFPNFRPFSIRLSHYHQSGATAVQELAYGFASLIELVDGLEKRGISPEQVFETCMVCIEAGSDFFYELTKIKAARILFHQIARLFGVEMKPEDIEILAGTSGWTKSMRDVTTNLLRNTSEAMSAILGGCNGLVVSVHDPLNLDFSLRMARNVSNILKEESFFDKVLDPAAGSYYLERLLEELLKATKGKLQQIEKEGGWWHSFSSRKMQQEIRDHRISRMQQVVAGKSVKIGANKYFEGEMSQIVSYAKEEAWQLLPYRDSQLFEHQIQNPS